MPRHSHLPSRRTLLQAGISGVGVFSSAPWVWGWAQTAQGLQLQRLPKVALIIGNSKYRSSPLKNPANDAKAMQATLAALGFEVTLLLDADKAAMESAAAAHLQRLERQKCVGLFYYAGHGIQAAWKNYMLAVDANLDSLEAVVKQSLELNALMAGLTRAANPMNIIMLDACRDNPFGGGKQPEQKGLSQMDAPVNTILAYATAPGNTASDGEGENGLYTEQLLRELRVREAKVEDVFKRVRLAVRRKSKGAQIPWESTSLEEDFYFIPPVNLAPPVDDAAKQAQEEARTRAFTEELRLWESIESGGVVAAFEDYLQRYPSGRFSELAQLRLEKLLAGQGDRQIRIPRSIGNPFSKGTARTDTDYRVGDSYSYRILDLETGRENSRFVNTVTSITDDEVLYDGGNFITDLLGNTRRFPDGRRPTGTQNIPLVFELGRRWSTRYLLTTPDNRTLNNEVSFHISARESLTVPAGTFDCFRYEGVGSARGPGQRPGVLINADMRLRFWMAPEQCRRPIAIETSRIAWARGNRQVLENSRRELVAFKQA